MVQLEIADRGITDPLVLGALGAVRREPFVRAELAEFAYEDNPLTIDVGQTISQPSIVAIMAQAAELDEDDRVLEIGTGSGYGAAVLARLSREVWTIERLPVLAAQARTHLSAEAVEDVHIVEGDGSLGLPDKAPFDAMVVTAGAPTVPGALKAQLADEGRLIIPVGNKVQAQTLTRIPRQGDTFVEEGLEAVRFVRLIGEQGWEGPR
jgi:protein-L-isoaspartate(D-aspartate) O-methyltransferase